MRKLGVSTVKHEQIGVYDQIPMIKEAGFDCFFFTYRSDLDLDKIRQAADRNHLEIETVHLPFSGVNALWEEGPAGDEKLSQLLDIIRQCAAIGVDKAIMHCTIHSVAPPVSDFGFQRFLRLFSEAQACGVHIAIENLEPLPHLSAVMEVLPEYHGFCWDCGHNLCYTPMEDMMAKFGHRLICTHIHDNQGIRRPGDVHYRDDLHLLPFDGALDWQWFADKIKNSGFEGPLTLELSLLSKKEYAEMPLQEFFNDAYRRGQMLISMVK